jgi:hypothetical protein
MSVSKPQRLASGLLGLFWALVAGLPQTDPGAAAVLVDKLDRALSAASGRSRKIGFVSQKGVVLTASALVVSAGVHPVRPRSPR